MKKSLTSSPLVNIVIVTFNGFDLTGSCIASLMSCGYDNLRIYLVDNGSEEKNFSPFYNTHKDNPKVEFIRLSKNLGFGGGCNTAIRKIVEGYIVILSNDTEVSKGWLQPIIAYMEKNPDVGACQPKIKDIKRKEYFEYAGAGGGFMDVYGFPFTRGRIFFTLEKDEGQYDDSVDIVWCSGVAIITKKEVLDKAGLFDEIFFLYAEEADLCWRIYYAGFRMVYIPSSVVYHYGSKKSIIDKTFFSHRNGLIMLVKNYSIFELLRYFPCRIVFDVVAFFFYVFTLHLPHAWDLISAYGSFLSLLPKTIQIRKETMKVKNKYKNKNSYPLYSRSIVLDYFIFGKKKFSQLNYAK